MEMIVYGPQSSIYYVIAIIYVCMLYVYMYILYTVYKSVQRTKDKNVPVPDVVELQFQVADWNSWLSLNVVFNDIFTVRKIV